MSKLSVKESAQISRTELVHKGESQLSYGSHRSRSGMILLLDTQKGHYEETVDHLTMIFRILAKSVERIVNEYGAIGGINVVFSFLCQFVFHQLLRIH